MVAPLASLAGQIAALPPHYLALWGLLGVLTIAGVVAARTEWGRRRPTWRYALLAAAAHAALICLATTVRFISAERGERGASPVRVRIVMKDGATATTSPPAPTEAEPDQPAEAKPPPTEAAPESVPPEQELPPPPPAEPPLPNAEAVEPLPTDPQPATVPAEQAPTEPVPSEPVPSERATLDPPPLLSPPEQRATLPPLPPLPPLPIDLAPAPTEPLPPLAADPPPAVSQWSPAAPVDAGEVGEPVDFAPSPTPYMSRRIEDRLKVVHREGGSLVTEDAVAAGLAWLASAQSADGRWDSDRWSGGRETWTLGQNRRGAGGHADTGVTGLALLAMLGAGHTQEDGLYADSVSAGVEFLIASQKPTGDLSGEAAAYAQTYCHSMATFALAEALAGFAPDDPSPLARRLRRSVRLAVDHLVSLQHTGDGGWRYKRGQRGDLSQMGWVIMALRSAELADVPSPPSVWSGIERFLRATRRGDQGGLACYQPHHGAVSRTMTAESLYCRQIVGWPTAGEPATAEAIAHLLTQTPGQGKPNFYYWYYASLAIHHGRHGGPGADEAWRRWNSAMSRTLVELQVSGGPHAGSWAPATVWGGYGGRVYSTAMATMCLEVYYRYDPTQLQRDPWVAARPGARIR